jgi:trimeric autotransporter adhesin
MRHICIALALSTLLFVSATSAQQAATETSSGNPASTTKSGVGIDTVVNCATAANNYIPVFTAVLPPNITICNSAIYQDSTGKVGVGTTTPAVKLDVSGHTNTSLTYEIGGVTVLSIGSAADNNLFVGVDAGVNNIAGRGIQNVFLGNTAGEGNTTGNGNVFSGLSAGGSNTSGSGNTFIGRLAGASNTSGTGNTYIGANVGFTAAGSNNTFIGSNAGETNTTGNNNIYVGPLGCDDPCTEDSTIHIGGDNGSIYGPQTKTFIVGIYGSTSSGGIPVYINSNGRLGTTTSSLRFKEQVRDMGDSTSALMKLRPVTFLYKAEYADGEHTLQYGLIAEEVAKVYPELVAYDKDGQAYSVRYQYITTMLLNEVQKQYHRAQSEAEVIKAQERKIDELEQRLSRLEGQVRAQMQTVAQERE